MELISLILVGIVALGSIAFTTFMVFRFIYKHALLYIQNRKKPAAQSTETNHQNHTPQKPEIRCLSDEYCPKSGPYYIFEHPNVVQSFIKGEKMPRHSQDIGLKTVTWIYIPPAQLAQRTSNFTPPAKIERVTKQPQVQERPSESQQKIVRNSPIHDHILFDILTHIQKIPYSPNFTEIPQNYSNEELTNHLDHCIRMKYIHGTYNPDKKIALFSITPGGQSHLAKLSLHHKPKSISSPPRDNILLEICQLLDKNYHRTTIIQFEHIPGIHDTHTITDSIDYGISQSYIKGSYDAKALTAQLQLTPRGLRELEKL